MEDVTGWPEFYVEVRLMEIGTSSQPLLKKDKNQVPRSPRKQPVTTICFLCILEGVHEKSDLVGYVEKLK